VASTSTTQLIPLLDLRAQYESIRGEIEHAVLEVLASQRYILGPEVERLEQELAEYCQCTHAVGCASGTDALLLALMALDVGPGDEVITVPYTFFSTVSTIVRAGATPVFVDIGPDTFNVSPELLEQSLEAHPRTKVVVPVHLFGACADMNPILRACQARNVAVIEDGAQAIGAEDHGRRAGSMGALGCFSFYPSKNLGGCGDGGLLTTQDEALALRLRALRVHGSREKYIHEEVGLNSRLDALQAAILRVKLRHLNDWISRRQANAAMYHRLLGGLGLPIQLPVAPASCSRHVYNQFVILAEDRDQLRAHLAADGIGTDMYYPMPLHLQKCFAELGYRRGEFAVSERCAESCLALPVYPELTPEGIERICGSIARFYGS
jgi:dTDP-4-amino-4,6-dideoxygalactose transaminase